MPDRVSKQRFKLSADVFIMITMVIDGMGAGVAAPILPQLIVELTGNSVAEGALYGGALIASFATMQIVFAPVLGNLSDRFGRRPVLLGSLGTFGINYLLMGFASDIAFLFVGECIAGAFGATMSTAGAYMADVSDAKDRTRRFGAITAAYGVGITVGPMLGGLVAPYGSRTPFFCSAGLALLNVAYGYFVLPESLAVDQRRPFSIRRANPVGALAQIRYEPRAIELLGAYALMQMAMLAVPATWAYFTMLKFGWAPREIGISMSVYAVLTILIQGILLGHVHRWIGSERTAYLGFVCTIIASIGYAFATQSWMMLAFIMPAVLGSLAGPTLISYLSNHIPANSQGELQGAVATVTGATTVCAPLLMTHLLSYFSSADALVYFPGAPYVGAALFATLGLLVAIRPFRSRSGRGGEEASGNNRYHSANPKPVHQLRHNSDDGQ